jgi:hypothetical protein
VPPGDRDCRLRASPELQDHLAVECSAETCAFQIGAGAENFLTGARQGDGSYGRVFDGGAQRLAKRFEEIDVEGVALVRPVDRQVCDSGFVIEQEQSHP